MPKSGKDPAPPRHVRKARASRGSSPLEKAILLGVILAVFAIVLVMLYTLESGYLKGTGSAPQSLAFASTGFFRNSQVTDINFSMSASQGLVTNDIVFKIVTPSGTPVPVGNVSSVTSVGCTEGHPFNGCGPGNVPYGSWYIAITDSATNVRALFDAAGWVFGSDLPLGPGYTLTIVSATSYIGSGDELEVIGAGGVSVSGGVSL